MQRPARVPMDSEIGILVAALLGRAPGFEDSHGVFLEELLRSGAVPKRAAWDGSLESIDSGELVRSRPRHNPAERLG